MVFLIVSPDAVHWVVPESFARAKGSDLRLTHINFWDILQFYSFNQSLEKEEDIPHRIILLTALEMAHGETHR